MARFEMTSFAFMLLCVPDPVCQTTSGNSSSSLPSITSCAAAMMTSARDFIELAKGDIRLRRALLDDAERMDKRQRHPLAANLEVAEAPLRLSAPIVIGWHFDRAECVGLCARGLRRGSCSGGHGGSLPGKVMKLSTTRARQAPLVELALSAAPRKALQDMCRPLAQSNSISACCACSRRSSPPCIGFSSDGCPAHLLRFRLELAGCSLSSPASLTRTGHRASPLWRGYRAVAYSPDSDRKLAL